MATYGAPAVYPGPQLTALLLVTVQQQEVPGGGGNPPPTTGQLWPRGR